MVRKLASKTNKVLLSEAEIREQGLPKGDFTNSWKGRIVIIDKDKSIIAKKLGIDKEGEYAIKVR